METRKIAISDIDLSDTVFQARLGFDQKAIENLALDIQANGLRNPIGVQVEKKKEKPYRLLYGFRRTKAHQFLDRDFIEAKIYDELTQRDAYIHNLSDNLKHKDLTDLEIALRLHFLRENLKFEIEDLANLINRGTATVHNLLRLTTLEKEIQLAVHQGKIGLSHALEIARFPDFNRLNILKQVLSNDLSVNRIKQLRGISKGIRKVTLTLPKNIADILEGLPTNVQTSVMERIMSFGTRPHNPQWYENFGRGTPLDAVKWDKKLSKSGIYNIYYEKFIKDINPKVPKCGCEYSVTIAATKVGYICPNEIEWVVLDSRQTEESKNPLENRPAWFFWCKECIEEGFPNTRFLEDYTWYPRTDEIEHPQHIVHKSELPPISIYEHKPKDNR